METEAAKALVRVQIAMWIGDDWCHCNICGHVYDSVDDFIANNPVYIGKDDSHYMIIADEKCYEPDPCISRH